MADTDVEKIFEEASQKGTKGSGENHSNFRPATGASAFESLRAKGFPHGLRDKADPSDPATMPGDVIVTRPEPDGVKK